MRMNVTDSRSNRPQFPLKTFSKIYQDSYLVEMTNECRRGWRRTAYLLHLPAQVSLAEFLRRDLFFVACGLTPA